MPVVAADSLDCPSVGRRLQSTEAFAPVPWATDLADVVGVGVGLDGITMAIEAAVAAVVDSVGCASEPVPAALTVRIRCRECVGGITPGG